MLKVRSVCLCVPAPETIIAEWSSSGWRSVERGVEDPGEHRVGFMVMALGGVFFRGVKTVLTWREHFCKPQKGDPTETRTVVGLAFGPGV